ncbi:aromatic ring-hydroxylating oxygenase subunit alpha [Pseudomonas serbica]|jgi:phenylpropionate dioxygenase-like ring-hydroxylating dioxygenase large terminal subunit|uniref:aromatic ring-hydroxylating oxygenase subunit alpha n=1 Tax=Pseudomonas serbica TaxID=2965074 RepID=UPI00237B7A2B|nr:aromatic ring-hydroxylating dioxygenase subunit alpha [Pseudomonas serbica]
MEIEAAVWNEWYPVAVEADLKNGSQYRTRVLGCEIEYGRDADGVFSARLADGSGTSCRTQTCYHTHWISLGQPDKGFFALPEFNESDRRVLGLGSMQIHASGLRVVENFLDMAHFPYVHGGLLGEVPHTDVKPYQVVLDKENDEIFANDCSFYQPMAGAAATGGIDAQYIYRVVRPLASILYKTSVSDSTRRDVICLFTQPLSEDWCVAHLLLACIDDVHTDSELRLFQQTIVGQDLMILSNHLPRTLPLDPKFEVPTRADAMSAAYRRWLSDKGVVYGTYRAA